MSHVRLPSLTVLRPRALNDRLAAVIAAAVTQVVRLYARIPFSRKLRLFPLVTGATLGVILTVVAMTAMASQRRLVRLGDRYYPRMELLWSVEQSLGQLQRALQEGATAGDPDALVEADSIAASIRARLDLPEDAASSLVHRDIGVLFDRYYAAARDVGRRLVAGEVGDAVATDVAQLRVRHQTLAGVLADEVNANRARMVDAFSRVDGVQRQAYLACIGLGLLAVGVLFVLSRLATRSITLPLHAAVDVANRVAEGDLDVELPQAGGDEVGNLLRSMSYMVENLRSSERRLVHQATHDALTRLPNRTLFHERVTAALEAATAAGNAQRVAVLALDLDGFKLVNDSAGHAAGDALLRAVAERLLNATRGCDVVARLGGDEFAVLLENVNGDAELEIVSDRIVNSIARPFALFGTTTTIGVSIGIARGLVREHSNLFRVVDATSLARDTGEQRAPALARADELLRDADIALYAAKARGKGQAVAFEPSMYATTVQRVTMEAALRRALQEDELALVYQPILDLHTGTLAGVEALVRWHDPERGLVMPGQFIPLAEETGLIRELGRWVLDEACRQGVEWASHGAPPITVTVNVSGRQLQHGAFVEEVRESLARTGFPANRLILELTESTVIHYPDLARQRLSALKAIGVRFAIDDFGTGYSALSYLRQFPIDVLKIDKSFVDDIVGGGQPAALAGAIVALGGALGLRTVAEGVESEAQAQALEAMGCSFGQGYHFSRPVHADSIAEWLRAEFGGAGGSAGGSAGGGATELVEAA